MRVSLLLLLLSSLPACLTTRYQESQDLYRWRQVGVEVPRTLLAGSVRLSPDGMPWAVRLRVQTDGGEIIDYVESNRGTPDLVVGERGFEAPSQLHRTGNTPIVVVATEGPDLEVGASARRAGKEGGELSAEAPLTEEEARTATVVLFKGTSVTVLAPPPGGRRLEQGRVSMLQDRGRTFALETPRRGAWVVSKKELVKFYAFLPLPLLFDAVLAPVSVTGLLLHYAGHDGDEPAVGRHHHHDQKPWEPPDPPVPELPKQAAPND